MSNKFLGLDTINVLKKYIDEQILLNETNSRIVNLHAYKYVLNIDGKPETPQKGSYDPEGGEIIYPIGWSSLKTVLSAFVDEAAIENALSEGSIWMSVGVSKGNSTFEDWSNPIKINGQNGVSVRFAYSYDDNATEEERTPYPTGVNTNNRIEYVWSKYGDDNWVGPTIWAMYNDDSSDVLYRYCVTETIDMPNAPASDIDPNWTNSAAASVTDEKPFMWMTSKRVPAGTNSSDALWSEPILFGHYGMDGRDGLDGNIPKYSITLYAMTSSIEEVPEFVCEEGDNISEVIEANTNWSDLPTREDETETSVWWYVVVNVNGGDKENPELINTVNNFSTVKRFSALDGEQLTSVYTQYLYYWSSTQVLPNNLTDDDWLDAPVYNSADHDGSLWMKMGVCKLNTRTGEIEMVNAEKPWSDPVKISGPRGPIAYDYRTESVFGAGDETNAPTNWRTMAEVRLTDDKPYIWEKRYLSLYRMKYADKANADGTYDVVEDAFIKTIGTPDVFRLSGLNGQIGKNGANGNRLNTIDYTTTDKNLSISNFDEINYFISNSASDTHYVLNGNKFGDFVSGYTGRFVNIGTGDMIVTTIDAKIVGSNTAVTEMIIKPQEAVDLIGYNNNGVCQFILMGKPIITNPIEDPGVLSETALLDVIMTGGEVKLGGDIELSDKPMMIENDVVIDLNGHTITAPKFTESNGDILDGETDSYAFLVKNGNLTIKGNGKIIAQPAKYSMAVWAQGGNVTIESGEFRNGGQDTDLIYASGNGNITINGGKFIAAPKGNEPGTKNDYCALNLKNGDRATCSISVKGGHFYGFNPAQNNSEPDAAWWEAHPNGFVADGFVSIKNGDWYTVIPLPEV
jgi:hypothetical protein